jgi:TolB-like protein
MAHWLTAFWRHATLLVLLTILSSTVGATPPTLAVWDFDNNSMGSMSDIESMEPYRRIYPEALMARLADAPDLKLVERIHLREVLDEQKLGSSELSDVDARLRIGRLLGARYMVFGDYLALGPVLRLDVRLVDTETSRILFSDQLTGDPDTVLAGIPDLAAPLLSSLGVASAESTGVSASTELWHEYERGMLHFEAHRYEQAIEVFRAILKSDPGFKPAERQLVLALGRLARQP